jgi:hypothetical protein
LTAGTEAPETAIPALTLRRFEAPTERASYKHEPSVCLVAQGSKRVFLGDDVYVYDAHHFPITSVNLPVVAQVIAAGPEKPYLGLKLILDLREVSKMMVDGSLPMAVSGLSLPLLNAFHRLVDLLDEPDEIPALAPLIEKEIIYRLLVGEQGPRLRQIAAVGSQSHKVSRAIGMRPGV